MKTAMQELWDVLNDAEHNGVYEIGTQNFKRYIEGIYLEKEKNQIIEAVEEAISEMNLYESFRTLKNGEQYYQETFVDNTM